MEYFGHMGFGGVMWIVIIGLIFYLSFMIARNSKDVRESDSALEILKKRFAAGEISEEDFKRMKNDLLGG
ncbi:MAG TPA: SHOCT domain-containing protein [Caldithrix abyssi]|uniref:SHOCT domain-containing protein n=1 Tax=Caldithrix abyssi TaxID=187145 RepID=A0A7V1LWZ3_CALAY|nr:SHOCT domain-containing protein [Caldithrix abyssi]